MIDFERKREFNVMIGSQREHCVSVHTLDINTPGHSGGSRFENPAFATFLIIRITYAGSRQIEREPASKLRVQPVMAET